jgi:hypothetical protein
VDGRGQEPGSASRATQIALGIFLGVAFVLGVFALVLKRGTDKPTPSLQEVLGNVDPGPIHVHGLGINPADGSLLIATHSGTFRVAPNERKAKRIGENQQDTMGFTVAGPNYFLGSGHPDPIEARKRELPPLLGLIESRDAGRSWRPISLDGEADFHVLRFAGQRVYGYDSSNDRLLVSGDNGRTWRRLVRPAPLVDLVVDPRDPERLLAVTERGLYLSESEGAGWRPLARRVGFLGWPAPARLFLIEGSGRVLTSRAPGSPWRPVGDIGGQPAALLARSSRDLYVALHDGTIKRSADGGRTWLVRSTP